MLLLNLLAFHIKSYKHNEMAEKGDKADFGKQFVEIYKARDQLAKIDNDGLFFETQKCIHI